MLIQAVLSIFNVEYRFAEYLVLKGLEKTRLNLPNSIKQALINRVYRLRLDIRLITSILWFILVLIGLPLQFQIWDLESQVWLLRLISPILQFLAYCRGFCEGTCCGLLVAALVSKLIQWVKLQQHKTQIYYLLYRCKAL